MFCQLLRLLHAITGEWRIAGDSGRRLHVGLIHTTLGVLDPVDPEL